MTDGNRGPQRTGTRRRPPPGQAQRQLMARISAGRRARQQRTLLLVCGVMSALVLLAAGSSWALTSYVSDSVGRVNAGTAGTPASGPLNILVAGVDIRGGLSEREQALLHVGHAISDNSDVLMVAHIAANHRSVRVVSLPRDSWVDVPGHGMNKINAAFGIGGPPLMVRTVERATGLAINDYIEVNFLGFVKVIDALGGVNICLPYAVDDPDSGLHLGAGMHHVSGVTALEFARDRHSFPLSDLARISDQQQLLASMLSEAISSGTRANPLRLERFLSAASSALTVDQGLSIVSLAQQLKGISSSDVTFATVPLARTNYQTPTGQSAVLWDTAAARTLFSQMRSDKPPPPARRRPATGGAGARQDRRQVSLDVYNGTLIGGLSAATGTRLAVLGFRVHGSGLTWQSHDVSQTLIEYPAGQRAGARLVRRVLPGAVLRRVTGLSRVRIILGVNGHTVTGSGSGGQSGAGSSGPGSASSRGRSAAQDACR